MDKIRPWLYIAGFYSANPAHGLANASDYFDEAWEKGWFPVVPHVNFLLDITAPHDAGFWYDYDLYLLNRCQGIFVCPDGRTTESSGVYDEIQFACKHNIKVYHNEIPTLRTITSI